VQLLHVYRDRPGHHVAHYALTCVAGHWWSYGAGGCAKCPAGKFQQIGGEQSCEPCAAGKVSAPGQAICLDATFADTACTSALCARAAPPPPTPMKAEQWDGVYADVVKDATGAQAPVAGLPSEGGGDLSGGGRRFPKPGGEALRAIRRAMGRKAAKRIEARAAKARRENAGVKHLMEEGAAKAAAAAEKRRKWNDEALRKQRETAKWNAQQAQLADGDAQQRDRGRAAGGQAGGLDDQVREAVKSAMTKLARSHGP
jgi:hypothetical protein